MRLVMHHTRRGTASESSEKRMPEVHRPRAIRWVAASLLAPRMSRAMRRATRLHANVPVAVRWQSGAGAVKVIVYLDHGKKGPLTAERPFNAEPGSKECGDDIHRWSDDSPPAH